MSRTVRIPWQREHPFRYSVTEWDIDPDKTALLLMDFQAAYVRPEIGLGSRLARQFPRQHAYYYGRLGDVVIPNSGRLLAGFRKLGLPVIFTRLGTLLPGGRDLPPWSWRRSLEDMLYVRGAPEHDIIAELAPEPEELVIDRPTFSPFNSSPLDQVLRNMGVENLAIGGVRTEIATETTARVAGERGYSVFLIEDACATLEPSDHEDTFHSLAWAVQRSTDEVLALLAG
jgi:nicotinamidase-related amidase